MLLLSYSLTPLQSLKTALEIRLHKWQCFRRHIALRCKHIFGYQLSHRGYFGKVLFDHEAQTLQLKVSHSEVNEHDFKFIFPRFERMKILLNKLVIKTLGR